MGQGIAPPHTPEKIAPRDVVRLGCRRGKAARTHAHTHPHAHIRARAPATYARAYANRTPRGSNYIHSPKKYTTNFQLLSLGRRNDTMLTSIWADMGQFNRNNVVREVYNWVSNYLDVPSKHYGGNKPCPFAAPALDKQQVRIVIGGVSTVVHEASVWDDKYRLVLVAFEPDYEGNLTELCAAINKRLADDDLVAIAFEPGEHEPEDPDLDPAQWGEVIDEAYAMVLLQRLSEVNHFSRLLERQGYYVNCSADFMKYVNERRCPHARIEEDQRKEEGSSQEGV